MNDKDSEKIPPGWKLIDWDGNPELGYKCFRKKFGRGHVSVGIGDLKLICYSYGANSDDSLSSTRLRVADMEQTPFEAMAMVEECRGKYDAHWTASNE